MIEQWVTFLALTFALIAWVVIFGALLAAEHYLIAAVWFAAGLACLLRGVLWYSKL